MPISGDRYPFTDDNISKSPDDQGVYALYDGNELIYYGRAVGRELTIRKRLGQHKSGQAGRCTQCATHYRREVLNAAAAVDREVGLLLEYRLQYGELPRCNERVG